MVDFADFLASGSGLAQSVLTSTGPTAAAAAAAASVAVLTSSGLAADIEEFIPLIAE